MIFICVEKILNFSSESPSLESSLLDFSLLQSYLSELSSSELEEVSTL